jgi:hypothetical protein
MKLTTLIFAGLPTKLRSQLLTEYESIVQHYLERRWSPAELGAGRFCEVVYCIIDGFGLSNYPASATKPTNMAGACRALENRPHVPRSFQILIPRMLPCLYEIRNNRGVGHVGGDVDPNQMDSTAVLAMVNWIMAELVRVLHNTDTSEAQILVDDISQRRVPLVWEESGLKRVLDPTLPLQDQVLLLIASCSKRVSTDDLFVWSGYENKAYFNRLVKTLHKKRFIEFRESDQSVGVLPPGTTAVEKIVNLHNQAINSVKKKSPRKK